MRLTYTYDYTITATTDTNENLHDEGHTKASRDHDTDAYVDQGLLLAEAYQGTVDHFWTSVVERGGHTELSDLTITIRNLTIQD